MGEEWTFAKIKDVEQKLWSAIGPIDGVRRLWICVKTKPITSILIIEIDIDPRPPISDANEEIVRRIMARTWSRLAEIKTEILEIRIVKFDPGIFPIDRRV
jgi:hypothetical protein